MLALLVCHGARGLACGLAGSLALAAAAVCCSLLQGCRSQGRNMLHLISLLFFDVAVTLLFPHIGTGVTAQCEAINEQSRLITVRTK